MAMMNAGIYAVIVLIFQIAYVTSSSIQCSNTQTFCPSDGSCCRAKYSPTTFGCQLSKQIPFMQQHKIRSNDYEETLPSEPPHPTVSCCMPGPAFEPSNTLPNTMILGDSVSIGYTGVVVKAFGGFL